MKYHAILKLLSDNNQNIFDICNYIHYINIYNKRGKDTLLTLNIINKV